MTLSPADKIKCGACGRIFHDLGIFMKHKNSRCKDNAGAEAQGGAPGEYWGWEMRAVAVEFGVLKFLSPTEPPEKRVCLEKDRKVAEAQRGCGKSDQRIESQTGTRPSKHDSSVYELISLSSGHRKYSKNIPCSIKSTISVDCPELETSSGSNETFFPSVQRRAPTGLQISPIPRECRTTREFSMA